MFMSKAQPRATKEYYPPHLTGRGSRGLMALAFELFALSEQFSSVFTEDTPETADLRAEGPSYPPHT